MKISRLLKVLVILTFLISISNISMAQSLGDRARKFQQEIKEKQRIENTNYNETCRIGTINAYRDYLKKYEKENYVPQEHITDIKNRIVDYDVWSRAKAKHTISAYESYIKESKYKSYVTEANEAITDIKSIDEWNKIKQNSSIDNINAFLAKYPKTSQRPDAQNRIYELTAVSYYKSGNLASAYLEFEKTGGKQFISSENRIFYDKSEEYYEYYLLGETSKEVDLTSFLNKYPHSDYYDKVSNMVAISKAKEFSMYTGESSFNAALRYAKDDYTKKRVKLYIDSSKKEYSKHKKQKASARRFQNGGTVLFGFELLDFGWNGISSDVDYFDIYYYNMGLSLKLGNYKDPVQFEVGVKPGLLIIDDGINDIETKFHMPAYARLKLNLLSFDNDAKFYISGLGYYNAVRNDELENEYSVGGGIGMAWRHWDWHMLYYKQDLNIKNYLKNNMLGTSIIYYFN